ncbi:hypothetical protein GCM10010909_35550 [Acidocella aquatica]|uniref:Uncharacterized protein n=2 Tax=Acidocella aquatica TaxID=1922313 RepID=A0ABQ6ABD2_9PROT|nr:hypothetical protein GCM10010909_35550 [Acidocella aquatica]
MTTKTSYGFILWAVPRFHRPAQITPNLNAAAPQVNPLFAAARAIEVATAPAPGKTTASLTEASDCQYAYH